MRIIMLPYRTIALLLSASLTAGCMVGPDYKQPEVALADHYVADAQPLTASDTSVGSLDVWWEGFGDPLLSRLVTEALGQNLQLAQAQARVAQARAALAQRPRRLCRPRVSMVKLHAHGNPLKRHWASC